MSLSGIDLRVIVHELESQIIGCWIVNIYQLPNGIFIFKLRKPQVGLIFLLIEPGKRIHLTEFNRIMPKEPTNFCKNLRSHLKEKRINEISQRNLDRIVILNIGPDEGYKLIIELFGYGNLIMVSPANKILSALRYRKMRDRDIHPGREFEQMPALGRDILRNGADDIETYLKEYPKLVISLNHWLGLGPYYSKYILKISNIKKKKSDELNPEEINSIKSHAEELRERLENHRYSPVVYLDKLNTKEEKKDIEDIEDGTESISFSYDDQWEDVSLKFKPEEVIRILPWDQLEVDDDVEKLTEISLNQAFDIFYSSQETNVDLGDDTEELETEVDKFNKLLNQQLSHQQTFLEEAEKYRMYADLLYANFQPASDLISTVYKARKNKMNWEEIEARIEIGKAKNMTSALLLSKLLPKEAKMELTLSDGQKNEKIVIDFRKSLTDNANIFYDKAKKSSKKAKGADIAIKRTKDKIEKAVSKSASSKLLVSKSVPLLKRRKVWYEKFHWCITENDQLIIAGTDASSNEKIVKRYLDPDDLFLHGDVHGAPATVIKSQGKNISEATISIAASIAAVYSSAWKAKQVITNVFYVDPEQVSFTPPSGEFLPKGSFMIYGQKNYIKDVKLEICIGLIIERNWARLMAGPKTVIEKLSYWVRLEPGDNQRGTAAKQIKMRFVKMVSDLDQPKVKAIDNSEISSLIPGDCKIVEWNT